MLHRDPAPLYRYLRDRAPALELADGTWIVTRHADVARLLRSRAISSAQIGGDPGGPAATLAENGKHLILASDPPVHTRRRGAVAHRFGSHPVEALAPAVDAHVAHRLDALAIALERDRQADLVAHVCGQIPMDALCSLLGLPPEAAPDLRRWTTALVDGLDPWADDAAADRAGVALAEVVSFLAPQVAARRTDPRDDLMSVLATAPDLTADEQLHNTVLFLNAGLDTSGDLLANALARLLETPGAWDHLVADPDGRAAAVGEEVARYDLSPASPSVLDGLGQRLRAEKSELLEKIAGGDWEESTVEELDAAIKEFADDFGYDLDEDGNPIEAGDSERVAHRAEAEEGTETSDEAEKETATPDRRQPGRSSRTASRRSRTSADHAGDGDGGRGAPAPGRAAHRGAAPVAAALRG